MYALIITEPTNTKAGLVAKNRKYSVQHASGSWTIRKFCSEHGVGLPAMIARLRQWPAGRYESNFMDIYNAMRANRTAGKYHNSGRKMVCPHCGEDFTRLECLHARRRKMRDASPPDHALRSMPAEFFGEGT